MEKVEKILENLINLLEKENKLLINAIERFSKRFFNLPLHTHQKADQKNLLAVY